MRILLTRPEKNAEGTAEELKALGFEVENAPLTKIVPQAIQIENKEYCAFIFTSQTSVEIFYQLAPEMLKNFKGQVFAVGLSTAQSLRKYGLKDIHVGGGDVHNLTQLIQQKVKPSDGLLYFPHAKHLAGSLVADLRAQNYNINSEVIYEALEIISLPQQVIAGLRDQVYDYIMFYSPRAAQIFTKYMEKRALAGVSLPIAVTISDTVAQSLDALSWREIRVAKEKTQSALILELE